MKSRAVLFFAALTTLVISAPSPAYANQTMFSASLMALAPLCFIYPVALLISRRSLGLSWKSLLFWVLFPIALAVVTNGHLEIFFYIWAFYIGLQFCFLLLNKNRVVYQDRQTDLKWYGAWTGIIIISSVIAKIIYWSDYGGLRGWATYMGQEHPEIYLLMYGAFGIPVLVYLLITGNKRRVHNNSANVGQDELPVARQAP